MDLSPGIQNRLVIHGVGRKSCVRGPYRIWFGHAPTPIWFSGLLGRTPEHMLMGLVHEHLSMGLAHEHMPMGLAHDHMLMEPDSGPNELKSELGQHTRTSEFEGAKSKFLKIVQN